MFFINFNLNWDLKNKNLNPNLFEEIAKLDNSFDPHPWKLDHWLKRPDDEAIFVLQEDRIYGWAVYKLTSEEHLAHLLKIHILKEFRGRGLGENLLRKSMAVLEGHKYLKFYLEVEKGNPAISIYSKNEFSSIHEIQNFYGQGRNAIVMMRQI